MALLPPHKGSDSAEIKITCKLDLQQAISDLCNGRPPGYLVFQWKKALVRVYPDCKEFFYRGWEIVCFSAECQFGNDPISPLHDCVWEFNLSTKSGRLIYR